MNVNIIFILFALFWRSFQTNILHGFDGSATLTGIFSFLILIHNFCLPNKSIFKHNAILRIKLIYVVYALIHSYFFFDPTIHKVGFLVFVLYRLIIPFTILSSLLFIKKKELPRFLIQLERTLLICVILNWIGCDFIDGRFVNLYYDINEIALINIGFLGLTIYNSIRLKRAFNIQVILISIPVIFALISASRMGFVGVSILCASYILYFLKGRYRIPILFLSVTGIILFYFLFFKASTLEQRLLSTTEQNEQLVDRSAEGTIFESFGDRGVFYVNAWNLFTENPILGIGLYNYHKYANYILHVDFLVHLTELGIIGFILYMVWFIGIGKKVYQLLRTGSRHNIILGFMFVSYTFCSFVLFTYDSYVFNIWFGLFLVFYNNQSFSKYENITINS
jgi:O-antigen ligase